MRVKREMVNILQHTGPTVIAETCGFTSISRKKLQDFARCSYRKRGNCKKNREGNKYIHVTIIVVNCVINKEAVCYSHASLIVPVAWT
jgi:hypothetical protein